jgi:hypothetical protein
MTYDNAIDGGYVILAKDMTKSQLWFATSAKTFKIAMYLLSAARYEDDPVKGLLRGQCLKSISVIAEDCLVSYKAVRIGMTALQDIEFIETSVHPKGIRFGTVVTIVNYDMYQDPENYKKKAPKKTVKKKVKPAPAPSAKKEPELLVLDSGEVPLEKINPKDRIKYNRDLFKFEGIIDADIKRWKEAYPAVIPSIEIKRMVEWIIDAGAKGHKKNWYAFITKWFGRAQEKGGTRTGGGGFQATTGGTVENWQEKELREGLQRIKEDGELKDHGII